MYNIERETKFIIIWTLIRSAALKFFRSISYLVFYYIINQIFYSSDFSNLFSNDKEYSCKVQRARLRNVTEKNLVAVCKDKDFYSFLISIKIYYYMI